uniref:WW domain binding protein 1 n=1 Tax=Sphenodon punctatus TaxID=8508 RepID=A0A8D0HN19_SPHPU
MERGPRGAGTGGWSALLGGRDRQAREYCPGVNNQPYVCETGHCCGETGCCTYYYELWCECRGDATGGGEQPALQGTFWREEGGGLSSGGSWLEINLIAYHGACNYPPSMMDLRMLASFKLPAYEEVAHQPSTPPPPYSTILSQLGGTPSHLGSSTLTLTPSSDNYTSCSCESSCLTSPSSTSLSGTEPSTPSEAEGGSGGGGSSTGGSWELPADLAPCPVPPPKHTLFSSNVELFEEEDPRRSGSDSEEGLDGQDEGEHFRHRRLTGDSGIEMGRGQDEEEAASEEEAAQLLGKGAPGSPQGTEGQSLGGGQGEGSAEEASSTPVPQA